MKLSKPIIMHIPKAYVHELNKYIDSNPPSFDYDIIYFYYLAFYINIRQVRFKGSKTGCLENYVPLNRKTLTPVCPTNIRAYIKFLLNGEFIICDNKYKKGVKSYGYIINPNYLKGVYPVEVLKGSRLYKQLYRILVKNKHAHYNEHDEHLIKMRKEFFRMELDYKGAENWVLNQSDELKVSSYSISLQQLKDKRFRYFNRNKTNNRLDTNLTNLKSDLKQFIIGDYVSIDLKNSQPFFLNQLIITIINSITHEGTLCCKLLDIDLAKAFGVKRIKAVLKNHQEEEEAFLVNLRSFGSSVNCGVLYDNFISSYDGNVNREEVKEIIFKVLFSANEHYHKEKKVFISVYPFIYRAINELKKNDHKILPITLQKIESYIFIDCIAKRLVEANILPFTIHDSIIVKKEFLNQSIEIIRSVFLEQFNVIPALEIKPLNNKTNEA